MNETTNENATVDYRHALGQRSQAYYLYQFKKFDRKGPGLKASWNWSAFFFGGIWALYRKMYGWFFLWFLLSLLTGVLETTQSQSMAIISLVITAVLWLIFSVYANSLYHAKIRANIYLKRVLESTLTFEEKSLHPNRSIHLWVPIIFGTVPVMGILAAVVLPLFPVKNQNFLQSPREVNKVSSVAAEASPIDSPNLDLKDSIGNQIRNTLPPIPEFRTTEERLKYLAWLGRNSQKLELINSNSQIRKEFLQTVWYESKRAGLEPSLVLSLISNLSGFKKFYVDETGARGYMVVGTSWVARIGDGNVASLFHIQPNLRYGCVVLRHYLDKNNNSVNGVIEYVASNLTLSVKDERVIGSAKGIVLDMSKWE